MKLNVKTLSGQNITLRYEKQTLNNQQYFVNRSPHRKLWNYLFEFVTETISNAIIFKMSPICFHYDAALREQLFNKPFDCYSEHIWISKVTADFVFFQ